MQRNKANSGEERRTEKTHTGCIAMHKLTGCCHLSDFENPKLRRVLVRIDGLITLYFGHALASVRDRRDGSTSQPTVVQMLTRSTSALVSFSDREFVERKKRREDQQSGTRFAGWEHR